MCLQGDLQRHRVGIEITKRKAAKAKATGHPVCPVDDCYGIMKMSDQASFILECLVCGIFARRENVLYLRRYTRAQANEGWACEGGPWGNRY